MGRVGDEGDSRESTLDGYLVFAGPDDANGKLQLFAQGVGSDEASSLPLAIAGLEGVTQFGTGDSKAAASALQVGNVLILSTDILLIGEARTRPESAIIRSTDYVLALLDHLDRVARDARRS